MHVLVNLFIYNSYVLNTIRILRTIKLEIKTIKYKVN